MEVAQGSHDLPRHVKTVLLIGSLDTKGDEYAYAREMLRNKKLSVHVMDFSVMEEPTCRVSIPSPMITPSSTTTLPTGVLP